MIGELFSLKNYCSIITGAAKGLGKYMSFALAEAGSNIVLAGHNYNLLRETAKEIENKGVKVLAVEMDVTNKNDILKTIDLTINEFGKIDVLINNAGIVELVNIEDMTYESWLKIMDVNLNGVFLVSQLVGRVMIKQQKGSIINISSLSGLVVNTPQKTACYNASKAGVIMLTKSMASEWVKHNIRVNAIAPGYMNMGIDRKYFEEKNEMVKRWLSFIPMGRPAEPEELGGITVYLASEASSYVTGGVFQVDGGYTIW